MLSAVDLDHQASFMAREIREVGADGGLAPEVRTLDRNVSQRSP